MCLRGNKGTLFLCFTMRELGEDGCEKGGTLSHLRPTCNLIVIKRNPLHMGSGLWT